MQEFIFHIPTKIHFGPQVIERIGEETEKLGGKALVVSTMRNFAREAGILKKIEKRGIKVALFEEVESNPSIETVEKGANLSKKEGCDVIIGLGGGSAIDTAKGIAVLSTNQGPLIHYLGKDKVKNLPLPIIAIPTTAGTGSEVGLYAAFTNKKKTPPRKETIGTSLISPE